MQIPEMGLGAFRLQHQVALARRCRLAIVTSLPLTLRLMSPLLATTR